MITDAPASRGTAWAYFSNTLELTETRITELTGCLSADERERAARFWHTNDRRDYVAAHALVRMALSAQTQLAPEHLRFGAGSYGKPFLRLPDGGTPPAFSLAHSRGLVACVLAWEGATGIDVEHVDASIDATRLATDLFSAGEVEALQRCSIAERPSRFCELWTLKEALFKAVGTGLRSELNAVSFRVDGDQVSLTAAPRFTHVPWEFVLMDVGGTHKLAIAIEVCRQHRQQLSITCCDLTRSVPLLAT